MPEHTIGLHSDDERDLTDGRPVFSVSWGASRVFDLKPKKSEELPRGVQSTEPLTPTLKLDNGDLVVMGGRCQQTHRHQIRKMRKAEQKKNPHGRRINFTFRSFRRKA